MKDARLVIRKKLSVYDIYISSDSKNAETSYGEFFLQNIKYDFMVKFLIIYMF